MGLALLLLRAGSLESSMFNQVSQNHTVKKGNFWWLLSSATNLKKYLACIGIGLPVWYVIGVLINLSNRFAAQNMVLVDVADCVMFAYLGLSVGDLLSGILSQWMKSRKKVVYMYLVSCLLLGVAFLYLPIKSANMYNLMSFLLGAATGYWALFVTIASEQFGTNIRSTVTNTVPNFVRGAVVPITLSFKSLIPYTGITMSALIVGVVCCTLALLSTMSIEESFSKDLNYVE